MGKIKVNSNKTSSRIKEPKSLKVQLEPQVQLFIPDYAGKEEVQLLAKDIEALKLVQPVAGTITYVNPEVDISHKLDTAVHEEFKHSTDNRLLLLEAELKKLYSTLIEHRLTSDELHHKIKQNESKADSIQSELYELKTKKPEEVTKIIEKEIVQEKIPNLAKYVFASQLIINLILLTILLTK